MQSGDVGEVREGSGPSSEDGVVTGPCGRPTRAGRPCGRVTSDGAACGFHGGAEVVHLRPVPEQATPLLDLVVYSIDALSLGPESQAMVELARRFAVAVDLGGLKALDVYGPKLRMTLQALGAVPAGGKAKEEGGQDALSRLRDARTAG